MAEGLTPAVDRATKDAHLSAERLWASLPAIYRKGVSAHQFHTPDGQLGEFHPGLNGVLILAPSGPVGDVIVSTLIMEAAALSEKYLGTSGVDHRDIPW